MVIVYILIALVIVLAGLYIGYRTGCNKMREELLPRVQHQEQVNTEIVEKNEALKRQYNLYETQIKELQVRKSEISDSIAEMNQQAEESAKLYGEKALEVAQLKIEASIAECGERYKTASQEYEDEYLKAIQESASDLSQQIASKILELQEVKNEVNSIKATRNALIQANLREKELKDSLSYHTLSVSETDLADIKTLNNLKSQLHKPEILAKLIWSTYFLQAANNLCNKVFGTDKVCGIYKITNNETQEVYIGQSVDCAERIKQHVKAGLGIDNSGTNKLYKAMQAQGVWSYSFELLEKCTRDKLDAKEKEYIAIYESDKYGYNSTKGNG